MASILETSPSPVRDFAPVHSHGGLVAAAGLLLATGAGLVTTLPGLPTASLYPTWATWALRLAPLLSLVLLWAVVHEAQYQVRTEPAAIHVRSALGGSTRVPWREVTDYFADCGRSLRDVAGSGGSLVQQASDGGAPFASYGPDYTLISRRGTFVFGDNLADVGALTDEITRYAPAEAPRGWEEASWVACRRCGERVALSLWPLPAGHVARYCDRCHAASAVPEGAASPEACACGGAFSQEALLCSTCGETLAEEGPLLPEGFIAEKRGVLRRPEDWPPRPASPCFGDQAGDAPAPPADGGEAGEPG